MTTGHWYVEQYLDTTTDVTGDFFGYEFQFYENGALRLKANYKMNLRTGSYQVTYPTGQKQVTGLFNLDKMDGKWTYFSEDGKPELEIIYINGVAQNQDKIDEHQKELLLKLESNKGKYPEPDETNIAPH